MSYDVAFPSVFCEYHLLVKDCFDPVQGRMSVDMEKLSWMLGEKKVESERSYGATVGVRSAEILLIGHGDAQINGDGLN